MRAHLSRSQRPTVKLPGFVRVQRDGWDNFLSGDDPNLWSIAGAFKRHFPVTDPGERFTLDFVSCSVGKPDHAEDFCLRHGLTYDAPVSVKLRLVHWADTDPLSVREVIDKDVQLGRIPLMTARGQFVLNGSYWTILSQIQKSPGLYVRRPRKNSDPLEAKLVTEHGYWSSLVVDKGRAKVGLGIKLDKRAPINFLTFLRACRIPLDRIVDTLAVDTSEIYFDGVNWMVPRKGHPITSGVRRWLDKSLLRDRTIDTVPLTKTALEKVISVGYLWSRSGRVLLTPGKLLSSLVGTPEKGTYKVALVDKNAPLCVSSYKDRSEDEVSAAVLVHSRLHPGALVTASESIQTVTRLVRQQVLGSVGRHRMKVRFGTDGPVHMTPEDYLSIGRHFAEMLASSSKRGTYSVNGREVALSYDEMDDYANRRLRVSGEVVGRYFDILIAQAIRRDVKNNLHSLAAGGTDEVPDLGAIFPASRIAQSIRSFFSSEQLIQLTDDLNPLAEVAHKRRITALGSGGLTRDTANSGVRDVHTSQFGRVCPIATPEGQNVGLVSSLAMFAKVQKVDGLIATPFENVSTGEVEWITAADESTRKLKIAVYDTPLEDIVTVRTEDTLQTVPAEQVTHRTVHPGQVVSASAALIPFMNHDDANRALMGSNMQRQAVPLLLPEAPIVGTGVESSIGKHASRNIVSDVNGVVVSVDRDFIVVEVDGKAGTIPVSRDDSFRVYQLEVCGTTNSDVAMRHKPVVDAGDKVRPGQVLADGPASNQGELALGRNLVAAYLPWRGYNFEDAFVVSERVVAEDKFSSLHTLDLFCDARIMSGTTDRHEEITVDTGSLSNADRERLDDDGVIHVGAHVKPGDVLVSKIAPKMEQLATENDPTNALLLAIFGNKRTIESYRFVPLTVPEGVHGVVTNVRVVESDPGHKTVTVSKDRELDLIERRRRKLVNAIITQRDSLLEGAETVAEQAMVRAWAKKAIADAEEACEVDRNRLIPNNMEAGVLKMVKVTIATRHNLQVGDKLALRHGNKGVVSIVVPQEEMPYLPDGTPVDILINPLGVPSRMNIGQLYEAHLGYGLLMLGRKVAGMARDGASVAELLKTLKPAFKYDERGTRLLKKLALTDPQGLRDLCIGYENGIPVATPCFQGANEDDIREILITAGCDPDGKSTVFDGRTGEALEGRATIGLMFVMKLHHMVAHKMHARSTGPYSLVTQQPLSGRSHAGGQRLGEMEVWAFEAYGAAYALQEMLTIKSDDLQGRHQAFKAIAEGRPVKGGGVPASTQLMLMELLSLGLDIEMIQSAESV